MTSTMTPSSLTVFGSSFVSRKRNCGTCETLFELVSQLTCVLCRIQYIVNSKYHVYSVICLYMIIICVFQGAVLKVDRYIILLVLISVKVLFPSQVETMKQNVEAFDILMSVNQNIRADLLVTNVRLQDHLPLNKCINYHYKLYV